MPRTAPRFIQFLLPAVMLAGCKATTTRPAIVPLPRALTAELRYDLRGGTDFLRQAFEANRVPIDRVELEDGYIESPWFSVADGSKVSGRPVGPDVLKVRAWVDPTAPGYVRYTVEIAYRPFLDPSRPGRDLEVQVPVEHEMSLKWRQQLMQLIEIYGHPTAEDSTRLGIRP